MLEGQRFVDNDKVVLAAAISAGIVMSLQVVRRLLGSEAFAKAGVYMEYDWPSASPRSPVCVEIERVETPTEPARELVRELDAELTAIYTPEQRHGFDIARLFRPGILFFVARLDGEATGCGGIAFDDGFAELKRMYVRPNARGRGVAKAILARLEEEACARDVNLLVLETGDAQQPAIRLYERAGFRRCAAFGEYAKKPQAAIQRSVFFEKRIAPNPAS
ncbi:MAG TPA: GNAT family N-acetyltransferase [Tepidisphaeraceae bacterium]|nr:GNAT family N-acetyltransferase [Tepidisphaeraceae bacterium]